MCYNGDYKVKQSREAEQNIKDHLSSDCSLQLENMKLESLVIVDQHATVNMFLGLVHTARHATGVCYIWNKQMNYNCYTLLCIIVDISCDNAANN